MKVYQHIRTGKKITEDTFEDLSSLQKEAYKYIGTATGDPSQDKLLLSGIIGYVSNSGLVGGLLGGDLIGGIFGDALNDDDDDSFFF